VEGGIWPTQKFRPKIAPPPYGVVILQSFMLVHSVESYRAVTYIHCTATSAGH